MHNPAQLDAVSRKDRDERRAVRSELPLLLFLLDMHSALPQIPITHSEPQGPRRAAGGALRAAPAGQGGAQAAGEGGGGGTGWRTGVCCIVALCSNTACDLGALLQAAGNSGGGGAGRCTGVWAGECLVVHGEAAWLLGIYRRRACGLRPTRIEQSGCLEGLFFAQQLPLFVLT